MGIGQELMIEAINLLKFKGCKTIKLDGVSKAVSLYERVGFIKELKSLRYQLELDTQGKIKQYNDKKNALKQKFPILNCKKHDLRDIFNIDRNIFGCNRENYLLAMFEEFPEYVFIAKDNNDQILGYLFGIYKNNTLVLKAGVAEKSEQIASLITSAIKKTQDNNELKKVKIGILENNQKGLKILKQLGFTETGYSERMYYGLKTDATINQSIFAIGDPAKG